MNTYTGIVKSEVDKVQPYRVWLDGFIIWFARTQEEAEGKLRVEKAKAENSRAFSSNLTFKSKI